MPWDEARLMAETSPRGIDRRRRGPAGGWWRGTSQWRTFCSTCSPTVGGRQYRVRGDAQVRLRSGLEAPMKLRPLARHRPPNSSLPELDAIFIIPGAAKRHKRLRKNQSILSARRCPTVDHSLVAGGTRRHRLQACPPVHLDIFRLLLFLLLNQGNSWIAQDPVVQVPCLAQGHRILVEDSGARCEPVALSSESSPLFVSLRSVDEQPGTLNRLQDRLHPGLSKQERPAADKVSNKQRCRRGKTRAERVSEAVESVFLVFLEGSDRKCRSPPL